MLYTAWALAAVYSSVPNRVYLTRILAGSVPTSRALDLDIRENFLVYVRIYSRITRIFSRSKRIFSRHTRQQILSEQSGYLYTHIAHFPPPTPLLCNLWI